MLALRSIEVDRKQIEVKCWWKFLTVRQKEIFAVWFLLVGGWVDVATEHRTGPAGVPRCISRIRRLLQGFSRCCQVHRVQALGVE